MKALEIAKKTAKRLNLDEDFVVKVYKNYWKSIKLYLESLPLKKDLTKEEFDALKTSINLPYIGKIYVDWDRYTLIKRAYALKYGREYDERYSYKRD